METNAQNNKGNGVFVGSALRLYVEDPRLAECISVEVVGWRV
jgi:hypothetical protein